MRPGQVSQAQPFPTGGQLSDTLSGSENILIDIESTLSVLQSKFGMSPPKSAEVAGALPPSSIPVRLDRLASRLQTLSNELSGLNSVI